MGVVPNTTLIQYTLLTYRDMNTGPSAYHPCMLILIWFYCQLPPCPASNMDPFVCVYCCKKLDETRISKCKVKHISRFKLEKERGRELPSIQARGEDGGRFISQVMQTHAGAQAYKRCLHQRGIHEPAAASDHFPSWIGSKGALFFSFLLPALFITP